VVGLLLRTAILCVAVVVEICDKKTVGAVSVIFFLWIP